MANQKRRIPGTIGRPRYSTGVPADSRARITRRPGTPRAANDNAGPHRLHWWLRGLALALFVGAGLLALWQGIL